MPIEITVPPPARSRLSDRRAIDRLAIDRLVMFLLFFATASVVLWQNARLTVLWDLSYILENATRIAAGDVPYRDFPFPYAPLTFVMQAAIIRLFGRALWHHVAWAAICGGAASALTYAIVRRIVDDLRVAVALTLPLVLLGIYCIVPHPFYDPDACLLLLVLAYGFLRAGRPRSLFLLGCACILPFFVKQNIGLGFLASLLLLAPWPALGRAVEETWTDLKWRVLPLLAGIATGGIVAAAIVAVVFGVDNYLHWTIRFAAERRLPPLAKQLSIFTDDSTLWWWVACAMAGAVLSRPALRKPLRMIGTCLIAAPLAWSIVRFLITDDPIEPELNLLLLWPFALALTAVDAVVRWRREEGWGRWLPLVIAGTVGGTFLSQSTWGSTYGIWPLLAILFAFLLRGRPHAPALAALLAVTMLLPAWPYIRDNQRLTYVKWQPDGGLAAHAFGELVDWTDRNIPPQDAILSLPGEDLFYFTTGRRPRVPVLLFDRTVNPYDARQLAAIAGARGVRWVIVKKRLQINGTPMENLDETLALLRPRFVFAARLQNYDIYRRER